MLEQGKISALQMAIMMNPTILATGLLLVPAITAKSAKQDLWLSPIWASFMGFMIVFVAYRLHKFYPNETIFEYSEQILGKILGKILGLILVFYYFHVTGIIVREYGEFVSGTFLHHTPMVVVFSTMIIVSSMAVYGGLEVIGRCSEMIVPVLLVLYLVIFVMLIKDLDMKHLFPMLENGLGPSLKGSVVLQSWFSEFILVSFFFPYLRDRNKGMKWAMISVLSVMFYMVLTNVMSLLLFGKMTALLTYPVMVAARYISIADFLAHLESIVMAIWVAGTFVKITVFYYVLVLGIAQWLKLSDFRPIVLPTGFLLILFGIWSAPNLQVLSHFLSSSGAFYLLSVQAGIPVFLLTIAWLKKKRQQMKGSFPG
ncbi:GerAB/ArcD/ProY family transporter [Neobacillus bataviensis]|uniref:GerAB/ArcD/ProY family transporter n=1 Tax=Neobacillus bataviensis TaxID=220685 RepID=UPI001CC0372D|nr:endospore germination permease [Neobacillus bataviensis]